MAFIKNILKAVQFYFTFKISREKKLVAIGVFFWLLNFVITGYSYIQSGSSELSPEKPSPVTVQAPRNVKVYDREKTIELKKKAQASIKTIYVVDTKAEALAKSRLTDFFEIVAAAKKDKLNTEVIVDNLESKGFGGFSKSEVTTVLNLEEKSLKKIEETVKSVLETFFLLRIKPDEIDLVRTKVKGVIEPVNLGTDEKAIAEKLLSKLIVPNYLPELKKTEEERIKAASKVKPVMITRQKGEVIIREGEIIQREDALVLESLGVMKKGFDYFTLLSLFALTGIILFMLVMYIRIFDKSTYEKLERIFLTLTLLTLFNFLVRILFDTNYEYLAPAPLSVIISNLMLGTITSMGLIAASLATVYLYSEASFSLAFVLLIGSAFALFCTQSIKQHRQLLNTSVLLTLAMGITGLLTSVYFKEDLISIAKIGITSMLNGFLSTVFALGLLPFLESAFHMTTAIRLLELSNPNHPLLKKLMQKAPGTYNHSIMTANLSEAAAQSVNGNPLLSRVAGYFHDIGKLKRPLFFVENQVAGENPHDKTSPALSRLIIASHVKDGVDIAREHRLPPEVVSIIAQHHGNSLVSFFYQKAKDESNGEIHDEAFRYSGAKPQTKEAAIVMLADSVEAAARSLSKPTPQRIEQMVRSVIKSKFEDGQLDESELTFHEIEKIVNAFVQVLQGFYHSRIEYPNAFFETKIKNSKRKNSNQEL